MWVLEITLNGLSSIKRKLTWRYYDVQEQQYVEGNESLEINGFLKTNEAKSILFQEMGLFYYGKAVRTDLYEDYYKAIDYFTKLLEVVPRNEVTGSEYHRLGLCYSGLGNNKEAIKNYTYAKKKAVSTRNLDLMCKVLLCRGKAYESIGEHIKALDDYELFSVIGGLSVSRPYFDAKELIEKLPSLSICKKNHEDFNEDPLTHDGAYASGILPGSLREPEHRSGIFESAKRCKYCGLLNYLANEAFRYNNPPEGELKKMVSKWLRS